MSTELQSILAEAIDDLSDKQSVWTFGLTQFTGCANALRAENPRMNGAAQHMLELRVKTSLFRYPWPKRGDEMQSDGVTYRIQRTFHDRISGITVMELVQSSAIEPTSPDEEGSAFSSAFSNGFSSDFTNGFDAGFSTAFA